MKKNFKFMLVALLAVFGFNNAFAADLAVDGVINDNAYYYKIKTVTTTGTNRTGTVYIQKINSAKTGEIILPAQIEITHEGKTYTFNVTGIDDAADKANAAFKDQTGLTKVTIPSTYEHIGSNAFYGCTNLATIDLSGATGLKTIANQAFVTIQVTSYDFSACTKLTGFTGEPFVEAVENKTNSFIEAITLPTSTAFKTIGTALSKLPNLETLNIDESNVTAIVANAFKGDAKLKSMTLPGTVKTIAGDAFKGSSVETLVIDATSIETIGDGVTPLYGTHDATNKAVLKSLTINNELKGIIKGKAFEGEGEMTTLALNSQLGTTGQIETNAFKDIDKIEALTIGDIADNSKGAYTIQSNAFGGAKLATVTIGDITAPMAIAANAFKSSKDGAKNTVTTLTIGDIKASALAIAADAFIFPNAKCTLTIGEVRSLNATTPVIAAGAFDFSAVDKVNNAAVNDVDITIGAVTAKGKNFTAASITSPANAKKFTLTFGGFIEQSALDVAILSDNSKLDELTFLGKVAEGGIKTGAFASLKDGAKVEFKASLAENAVEDGAFTLGADVATPAYAGKPRLTVIYSGTPDDATVIPFQQHAFLVDQLAADAERSVTLTITGSDDLKALIAGLQISIDNPAPYADANADIIYAVKLINVTEETLALQVFQKTGTTNSYGRWFLTAADYPNGLIISRRSNEGVGTLTLYTTYVENDAANKVVVINMQPIPCTDGKYYFKAADLTQAAVDAVNYADVDEYNTAKGTNLTPEQYAELPAAQKIKTPAKPAVPGLVVIAKATGTSNLEDDIVYEENTDGLDSNPWYTDNAVQISAQVVTNEQLVDGSGAVQVANNQDLYFITNPANHKGVTAPTYDFRHATNIFIDEGSFYLLAPKYNNAAARIVWLDGSEDAATGIENVKAANAEGAIFNLAGQQVDANYKGIVIKGGKKMIQK